MQSWSASIQHLDNLIEDQIREAERLRNHALLVGLLVLACLLPLTAIYFRLFLLPVVRAMVNETVSHQRAAENALEAADESNRRLKQTQAALDDHCAVCAFDLQQRIVAANPRMCSLLGYSQEKLLTTSFPQLIDHDTEPESLWNAIGHGGVWSGNLCHRTKKGEILWMDATVFPFRNREGDAVEFIVIETEITELVQARETAEEAVKAKSRFLAMMSHEIRTPMNGVLGFANLLAETPLDERQREYTRAILTSGESLLVIINDILDYSKLEAGRTEL